MDAATPYLTIVSDGVVHDGVVVELVGLSLSGLPNPYTHVLLDEVEFFLSYLQLIVSALHRLLFSIKDLFRD